MKISLSILLITTLCFLSTKAQTNNTIKHQEYIYSLRDTFELKAHVYSPNSDKKEPHNAIILFHGGGWVMGSSKWAAEPAMFFAQSGLVSIALDIRLCDEANITPLDAMEDARDAIRWVRSNAEMLNINPEKIIAYGWSSGGHLAVSAAIFNASDSLYSVSCSPNVLILESPSISLLGDRWPRHLLLGKKHIRDISPDEHIRPGLPPMLIVQGELDTMTPLAAAKNFQREMLDNGNICELKVFKNYGHLFTPGHLPDYKMPMPDPEKKKEALKLEYDFLKSQGFLE